MAQRKRSKKRPQPRHKNKRQASRHDKRRRLEQRNLRRRKTKQAKFPLAGSMGVAVAAIQAVFDRRVAFRLATVAPAVLPIATIVLRPGLVVGLGRALLPVPNVVDAEVDDDNGGLLFFDQFQHLAAQSAPRAFPFQHRGNAAARTHGGISYRQVPWYWRSRPALSGARRSPSDCPLHRPGS